MRYAKLLLVPCVALAAACASMGPGPCASGERAMVAENLYFGTSRPGDPVSPEEWRAFLDEVVTPRFSRGLSAWQAAGQWKSEGGPIVREPSYILNIVHESSAAADASITEIMKTYKEEFRQEAVLRVRSPACVSF
ncbi:MAG: DUF3574 domain-containing protein [Usitatibacter sp.]